MSRPDAPQPPQHRTSVGPAPVADPVVLPPPGDATTGGPVSDDDTDRDDTDRTDAQPGYEAV